MARAVNNKIIVRLATWILILMSALVFAWRGLSRALRSPSGGVDYAVSYTQGRAWLVAQNPYDLSACRSIYLHSGAPARLIPTRGYTDLLNFPSSFPWFATTAWLPWRVALGVWVTLICGTYIVGCILLARSIDARSKLVRTCVLCLALCFSPILAGIYTGQASVLCIALIVIAVNPVVLKRGLLAGLALGIAISLKPQLAVPFILFFVRKRDWRATFAAVAVAAVITIVSLVPLFGGTGYAWFASWSNNVRVSVTEGNANDASPANPDSWKLLNLETLLSLALSSQKAATVISVALVAVPLIFWWKRSGHPGQDDVRIRYLVLLTLSALVLLPVYHRNYDAGLLVFGITAIPLLWRTQRKYATVLAVLLAPFMVPLPALLETHLAYGSHASNPGGLMKFLLLRHEVLLLVAIAIVGLGALKNTAISEKPRSQARS